MTKISRQWSKEWPTKEGHVLYRLEGSDSDGEIVTVAYVSDRYRIRLSNYKSFDWHSHFSILGPAEFAEIGVVVTGGIS